MVWPAGVPSPLVAYSKVVTLLSAIRDAAETDPPLTTDLWQSSRHTWAVALSANGKYLATANADGTVHVLVDIMPPRDRKKKPVRTAPRCR